MLNQAGLPEGFAALLANAERGAAEGWLFDDSKQLQALIGRSTTSAQDTVRAALS